VPFGTLGHLSHEVVVMDIKKLSEALKGFEDAAYEAMPLMGIAAPHRSMIFGAIDLLRHVLNHHVSGQTLSESSSLAEKAIEPPTPGGALDPNWANTPFRF
jgi:hypothetical protein